MSSSGPTGFLGRSSSSNANMRGLVQFIADLRNARARELEEKRINKELANIRYVCRHFLQLASSSYANTRARSGKSSKVREVHVGFTSQAEC